MTIRIGELADLVLAAVDGKYDSVSRSDVRKAVARAIAAIAATTSEKQLLFAGVPSRDLETDVANQVRCLVVIERFWRFRPPDASLVSRVHSVSFGIAVRDIRRRKSEYVVDFGGAVPTQSAAIRRGLKTINEHLRKVDKVPSSSVSDKASFLAKLHSDIIRVHVFEDGNGRAARMLVQYCLRYWGDDYIVIPKFRNNAVWRKALEDGVRGDHARMAGYFAKRIRPRGVCAD